MRLVHERDLFTALVNGNVTAANTPGNYSPLFKGIANGSFLPIQVIQVYATRTSAADVIALW